MKICPTGWVTCSTSPREPVARPRPAALATSPATVPSDNAQEHLLVCLHRGASLAAKGGGAYLHSAGSSDPPWNFPRPAHRRRPARCPLPPPAAARGGPRDRAPAHHVPDDLLVRLAGPPNVVEEVILTLRPAVAKRPAHRRRGVVAVAHVRHGRAGGLPPGPGRAAGAAHGRSWCTRECSSVLFLNRVRGGALAVDAASCRSRTTRRWRAGPAGRPDAGGAPAQPLVLFDGTLTHGVLDADNQVPDGKLPGRLRASGARWR